MSKIKDLEHTVLIIAGTVLLGVLSSRIYNEYKTNVNQAGETFVVSNYEIGRGCVFAYNAEESGNEFLMECERDYTIFVETDKDDKFKPKTEIRFGMLSKNHPLNDRSIYLGDEIGFEIGEKLLSRTREKYKDHIPFQKILDKIKD